MKLVIEVNDEKELSGFVDDLYFVIYKDSLENRMNPTSEKALVAAVTENAALRAERDEAVKFIKYLRYLEEAEDANAVMWHIRKYEVKP